MTITELFGRPVVQVDDADWAPVTREVRLGSWQSPFALAMMHWLDAGWSLQAFVQLLDAPRHGRGWADG